MKTYLDAAHAMQTGVAMLTHHDSREVDPKHLRVGVNSAMVNQAAIAKLLIGKGIITLEEYEKAICEEMNAEADRYQKIVREKLGSDGIELH
jgi:hypothetical protein